MHEDEHEAEVRKRMPSRRKKQIHITLPDPLIAYAFRAACRRGESVSDVISDLLRRDMEKRENKS